MSSESNPAPAVSRRTALLAGLAGTAATSSLLQATVPRTTPALSGDPIDPARRGALFAAPRPDRTFDIESMTASPFGVPTAAIGIDGSIPGPEIRYTEGDVFRTLINNRLDAPATLHWHGMIVPNYMDGVPGVTQYPIQAGHSVFIEYPIVQSGTYWYHSHYRLQEQMGLSGPLVVEEKRPDHDYDHDVTVFLSDWLNQSPYGMVPQLRGEQPATEAIQPATSGTYTFPGDTPFRVDLNHPGFLMNGRTLADPWTMRVKVGDRIRLRLINGSTSSFFQVGLEDHDLEIIAADGQPVVPVTAGSVAIAVAERYDVLVTIRKAGSFTLNAAGLGSVHKVAGAIHTENASRKPNAERAVFRGPTVGVSDYSALKSPYPTLLGDGPVALHVLPLGGRMKKYLWSMGDEYYPAEYVVDGDATPVEVEYGQRVRVRMRNDTKMYHPMHLHGHSYRVITKGNDWNQSEAPVKDTVAVAPGDTVDIEFLAENPGRWFFHCHNLYHAVSGMARQVVYTSPPS